MDEFNADDELVQTKRDIDTLNAKRRLYEISRIILLLLLLFLREPTCDDLAQQNHEPLMFLAPSYRALALWGSGSIWLLEENMWHAIWEITGECSEEGCRTGTYREVPVVMSGAKTRTNK